jgi:hypothetical protein
MFDVSSMKTNPKLVMTIASSRGIPDMQPELTDGGDFISVKTWLDRRCLRRSSLTVLDTQGFPKTMQRGALFDDMR